MDRNHSIGEAARASELSIKAIRHYEAIGLIPRPTRRTDGASNGHRMFSAAEIDRLKFIRRARMLDIGLEDVRRLLAIRDAGTCPGTVPEYADILDRHLAEIEARIAQLRALAGQIRQIRGRDSRHGSCSDEGCGCLRTRSREARSV